MHEKSVNIIPIVHLIGKFRETGTTGLSKSGMRTGSLVKSMSIQNTEMTANSLGMTEGFKFNPAQLSTILVGIIPEDEYCIILVSSLH